MPGRRLVLCRLVTWNSTQKHLDNFLYIWETRKDLERNFRPQIDTGLWGFSMWIFSFCYDFSRTWHELMTRYKIRNILDYLKENFAHDTSSSRSKKYIYWGWFDVEFQFPSKCIFRRMSVFVFDRDLSRLKVVSDF